MYISSADICPFSFSRKGVDKMSTELSEQAKRAKAEYQRAWRAKNKDKCRQYKKNYWEKKALELAESNNVNE